MESVKPVSVTSVEGKCYEPHTIVLDVANSFEASARNAADGRFTVRLTQTMVSEHPAVAGMTGGGRRGSAIGPGGARRRASSVTISSAPPKGAMGTVAGDGGKRAGEAEGGKNKVQNAAAGANAAGGGSVAGDEMKVRCFGRAIASSSCICPYSMGSWILRWSCHSFVISRESMPSAPTNRMAVDDPTQRPYCRKRQGRSKQNRRPRSTQRACQ